MSGRVSISRKLAWRALIEYHKTSRDPAEILRSLSADDIPKKELDLAWEITFGAIRYLKKLDYIAEAYMDAPLRKQKPEIIAALRIGLYQLRQTDAIPEYAAVNETVALIHGSLSKKEAGFVNAVLRAFLREPEKARFPDKEREPVTYLSVFHSYPEWLVKRWHERLGFDETESLLKACNERPSLNLKVIQTAIDIESAVQLLRDEDIAVEKGRYLPDFIRCNDAGAVLNSDVFKKGMLNVQDESQGIAAHLLNPSKGSIVLDLCSAPGGKSIALADMVGIDGKVLSMDNDAVRLKQLEENIKRTGMKNIDVLKNDIFEFATTENFRYILLDVPCSGLGTVGSNVDLRWRKTERDIRQLAPLQKKMLAKASTLLADGGSLVYSTCTTEPEEIEEVIEGFLKANPGFELEDGNSSSLEPFKSGIGIYRSWPHEHRVGGGGFARLKKIDG